MKGLLSLLGSLAGWAGVLVCLGSGSARAAGFFFVAGYEAMTLFTAGIGLIATGCLFKLEGSGWPRSNA